MIGLTKYRKGNVPARGENVPAETSEWAEAEEEGGERGRIPTHEILTTRISCLRYSSPDSGLYFAEERTCLLLLTTTLL